jgi:flagellar biosynthetic protein FlhB
MAEDKSHGDKTEEATPRRREEAREQGQVALSSEATAALLLFGWLGGFLLLGGTLARATGGGLAFGIEELAERGTRELSLPDAAEIVTASLVPAAKAAALLIVPLLLLGMLVSYGQIGFRVTPKAVAIDFAKLDPAKGFGRLFSLRSLMRTLLAASKILVILTTVALIAWVQMGKIATLTASDLWPALAGVGHVALRCVVAALVAMLVLALADLFFQRWQHERELRMTRQELKQELKATEGDPHLRARIRAVQREMASRRMMSEVPKATVIVTNPTHYAVALRYRRDMEDDQRAPVVVAKGMDLVAQRIKELGREAGVPLYEDVALARALHARVELGQEIPTDLYTAVAEVLAFVYRVQGAAEPARA